VCVTAFFVEGVFIGGKFPLGAFFAFYAGFAFVDAAE
jgi:hypothetical protein